ncbi:MAG: efflux RND transporter periplasmic adaptor subunit [Oscillospiraceae bacterium]|nr:efflux RND transporter periplasmic adaptor subunit [Oscillospiraceae bacterium]
MKKNAGIKMLGVGLALALFSGCMMAGAHDAAAEEEVVLATAVETAFLERTTISSELTYIGQVQPNKTVNIASMLVAEVTSVNFNIGDEVEEGDVLFTVDAQDLQNQMRQLQASMSAASVGVESAQFALEMSIDGAQQRMAELQQEMAVHNATYGMAGIYQTDVQWESARRQNQIFMDNNIARLRDLENDRRHFERELRDLTRGRHRDEWVENPRNPDVFDPLLAAQYDALRLQMRPMDVEIQQIAVQQAQLRAAEQSARVSQEGAAGSLAFAEEFLETYREGVEQTQRQAEFGVESAQAQLQATQAQISTLQGNLNRAIITSPISGVVSTRNVEVGQLVSQAAMPFTIVQIDPVVVQVSVSEALINLVYVGQEVGVTVQALGDEQYFTGTVTIVSPIANQASTFPVRIELENPDGLIRPGMFSQVTFVQAQSQGNFVVARNVVQSDDYGQFVYVVEDKFAHRRAVTTGLESGNLIEITGGVSERDQIVVVGQEFLHDGILVNIVATNDQRAAG